MRYYPQSPGTSGVVHPRLLPRNASEIQIPVPIFTNIIELGKVSIDDPCKDDFEICLFGRRVKMLVE